MGAVRPIERHDDDEPESLGVSTGGSTLVSGLIQYEEYVAKLEGSAWFGTPSEPGVAIKMLTGDHDVFQASMSRRLPVLAAQLVVEPFYDLKPPKYDPETGDLVEPGEASDECLEHARLVEWNLDNVLPMTAHLQEASLHQDIGNYCFEAVEARTELPGSWFPLLARGSDVAMATMISELRPVPPRTIAYWYPREGQPMQVGSIKQWPNLGTPTGAPLSDGSYIEIKGEHLLRYTNRQRGGNFAGNGDLRPQNKAWTIKQALETLDALRHDKMNVGYYDVTMPEDYIGTEKETKIVAMARKVASHQQGYFAHGPDVKGKWETSGSGQGTQVHTALESMRRGIYDSRGQGHMALGNGDTGSYALAETQSDRSLLAVEVDGRMVETVWNLGLDGWSPVRRIVARNYGRQLGYPKVRLRKLYRLKQLPLQGGALPLPFVSPPLPPKEARDA